jgi:hypothetical protein
MQLGRVFLAKANSQNVSFFAEIPILFTKLTACRDRILPDDDPEQVEKTTFDAFDVTKVWPHDEFPLQEFGKIVLNKNPDNYHRDVDQAAFSTSSLVPGVEASPDMLL